MNIHSSFMKESLISSDFDNIPSKNRQIIGKRIFDIIFSFIVLLFCSPLFLLIALGIFLHSGRPIFYRQKRLGRGGLAFDCIKFRTMVPDADSLLVKLLNENPSLKSEWTTYQKCKNDPRIFWLGKYLRKTSIDELPQFWNVLKGDLSVVGPRPYMECQKNELGSLAYKIFSVRPGITGLWQTSGRNQTTFKERIELDAQYTEICSFWSDIFFILKTIPVLFFSKNAW